MVILSILLLTSLGVIGVLLWRLRQEKVVQKEREAAMLHQARLAQMGEMMSLIAHQWRQPLSEISGMFMELEAASRFNKLDRALMAKTSARATKLLDHMSQTIDDFRHFFKPSKAKEAFDVESVCQEALLLAKASLRAQGIKTALHVRESCKVVGYPREVAQVLLSLLLNAKDALVEREVKEPQIALHVRLLENAVRISVHDNAGGLDAAVQARLFEPYVSTKAEHGTGLGLYMGKIIVEQSMGGKLWYEQGDAGAVFVMEVARERDDVSA
ncbi:sensor histidine kinase [Sulfurospirillum tamanense]|nr:HAMP domain-containing sensor histidine kinase [Sulfurospirillum tamanensis]